MDVAYNMQIIALHVVLLHPRSCDRLRHRAGMKYARACECERFWRSAHSGQSRGASVQTLRILYGDYVSCDCLRQIACACVYMHASDDTLSMVRLWELSQRHCNQGLDPEKSLARLELRIW